MALSTKSEALQHVPWFSLAEWHQVYNQIYSNDTLEQTKAYETLLVWKARIPKLPVGVECTLSIIQVCLRDRAWTPKIDKAELPMYYENDLCLMYSTTIMRFLNHISNIGPTKQSSLFQIAKQLKIPDWIVNLRHDAAHGHELPAIGSLRMAANVILTWLHEEYWAPEAMAVEEIYEKSIDNADPEEDCDTRAFVAFIELWIAVGLYIKANYKSVGDLPDEELRDTLLNLCTVLPENPLNGEPTTEKSISLTNDNDFLLVDSQNILFTEISALITKNKSIRNIEDIVMKILFDSETFLAGSNIIGIFLPKGDSFADGNDDNLPIGLIKFWQNFIGLLHEKKLLEELIWRLFELVNDAHEDSNKRLMASLWIKTICQSLIKLRIGQSVAQSLEHSSDDNEKRIASKQLFQRVRDAVEKNHPELTKFMWFNVSANVPEFLKDLNFATDLLTNANEFTIKFIHPILDLVEPSLSAKRKEQLLRLLRIHTSREIPRENNRGDDEKRCYGVEDLAKLCNDDGEKNGRGELREIEESGKYLDAELADRTIRNDKWEITSDDYDWAGCAFGVLPWQTDRLQSLEPPVAVQPKPTTITETTTIVPGLVDNANLTMKSHVNWDHVLRTKKRLKRKLQPGESDVIVDRAIEIVRKRQK